MSALYSIYRFTKLTKNELAKIDVLRINPLVVTDLKDIRDFIAEDNAEKALETVEEIYRVVNRYQDITRIFD